MTRSKSHPTQNANLPTTYQPLRVVLEEIDLLHQQLRETIGKIGPNGDGQLRANYLQDYALALEKDRIQAIRDYSRAGNEKLLETWVQYIPIESLVDILHQPPVHDKSSLDDEVAYILSFNQALVKFYRKMSETASVEEIETLFASLATQTEQEAAQLSWHLRPE